MAMESADETPVVLFFDGRTKRAIVESGTELAPDVVSSPEVWAKGL